MLTMGQQMVAQSYSKLVATKVTKDDFANMERTKLIFL